MADHPSRERWERELNATFHACGCDTGAKGLLIGLLGAAAPAIAALLAGLTWWAVAAAWLGVAVTGAVIGKLVGLGSARTRLQATVREIQREVGPPAPGFAEEWSCG